VVAICAIAALLLAVNGYTGYSIVVGAVGLSAAVNLLPSPYSSGPVRPSEPPPLEVPPEPSPSEARPEPSPSEAPRGEGSEEGSRTDVSGST
jgi:hypothetical protein